MEVFPRVEELLCKVAGDKKKKKQRETTRGRQVAAASGGGLANWLLGGAWEGEKGRSQKEGEQRDWNRVVL